MTVFDEQAERKAVVAEAMTWMRANTQFREMADKKGVGVDCTMLLVRCFVDTGAVEPFDPRPYPPRWFLSKDHPNILMPWLEQFGERIPAEKAQPGDVITCKIGRHYAHTGIVVDKNYIIHSYMDVGYVVLTERNHSGLQSAEPLYFDMWAKKRARARAMAEAEAK